MLNFYGVYHAYFTSLKNGITISFGLTFFLHRRLRENKCQNHHLTLKNVKWNLENTKFSAESSVTKAVIGEKAVSACIGVEEFLVFMSDCVWWNSGRRTYPIRLKFGTNVYILCKIGCTVFGVRWPSSACSDIHEIILMHYSNVRQCICIPLCMCMSQK